MKIAKVCNKWDLPFTAEIKDEGNKNVHQRSYLHYVKEHIPFVAAKCLATEWLLGTAKRFLEEFYSKDRPYSVREYMAGAGIQTLIIQKTFTVSRHVVADISEECVANFEGVEWDYPVLARIQDARKALLNINTSDMKFLDFPNSSILTVTKKWKTGFDGLFNTFPRLVVWTDTSISYPITIHGEKYSDIFGKKLSSQEDYMRAYKEWIYSEYGYHICAAAVRGKNAVYFCAIPFISDMEIKRFPLETSSEGFYFIGEDS